ncbi:MAG TPA: MFS transporter [Alphaproteobacteria bacterium]|nr:MFS transporter [Alphaproteobacteria bacterium]
MATVNAGARLDRLPISSFHRRIMWLIGAGMFFDGFDLYLLGPVLGATIATKFAVPAQAPLFVSMTFIGMTIGALVTGFVGDRYGRRFTYQVNLALFGLASLAGAFAPNMETLIGLRFLMGAGLGAEIVVGYGTMTEFVPPQSRGRWLGMMAFIVVAGFPATAIAANFLVPAFGWRVMFVIAGVGALIVWYLRKALPESPRWLEAQGRTDEAEALMKTIEAEAAGGAALPPAQPVAPAVAPTLASLFSSALLPRLVVGSIVLIVINTLIFGFVTNMPTFFVQQGRTLGSSLGLNMFISLGSLPGCVIGAWGADYWGRKPVIIGASALTIVAAFVYPIVTDPALVVLAGLGLIVPIYILTAILYGVYTAEIFPTEVRLTANGLCNFFGRGFTVITPFIIFPLFKDYGVQGVVWLMIGLLALQIVSVALWGVETRQRTLEDVAGEAPNGPAASRRATA